jgi:hypothetical protein
VVVVLWMVAGFWIGVLGALTPPPLPRYHHRGGLLLRPQWGFAPPPATPSRFTGAGLEGCYRSYRELYERTGDLTYLLLMLEYVRPEG